ncbi:MAG: hypothetical protein HY000_10305 [Planctomycetes bacterium]|nr:hypothetical protein [Planctomycetota bacterium]
MFEGEEWITNRLDNTFNDGSEFGDGWWLDGLDRLYFREGQGGIGRILRLLERIRRDAPHVFKIPPACPVDHSASGYSQSRGLPATPPAVANSFSSPATPARKRSERVESLGL